MKNLNVCKASNRVSKNTVYGYINYEPMKKYPSISAIILIMSCSACAQRSPESGNNGGKHEQTAAASTDKVVKSDSEWHKALSPEVYQVTRQHGTERAFTGKYWDNHEKGMYYCACCGNPLFSSDTKFDSGTGWPSFYAPVKESNVTEIKDTAYGMIRTEVLCSRCSAHLGHVFDDGPKPTGLRFCMNSASLKFEKK